MVVNKLACTKFSWLQVLPVSSSGGSNVIFIPSSPARIDRAPENEKWNEKSRPLDLPHGKARKTAAVSADVWEYTELNDCYRSGHGPGARTLERGSCSSKRVSWRTSLPARSSRDETSPSGGSNTVCIHRLQPL